MRAHRVALLALVLAACGTSGGPVGSTSSTSITAPATPTSATVPGPTVSPTSRAALTTVTVRPPATTATTVRFPLPTETLTIADADQGRTFRVAKGSAVELILASTYWQIGPSSAPTVLAPSGEPVSRRADCAPGAGCGTVRQRFVAVGSGTATLSASRTVCGEALACPPEQRQFLVTVTVTP